MRYFFQKLLRATISVFFLPALTLAASELRASPGRSCTGTGELGPCPPFTDSLCTCACDEEFGTFGSCDVSGCCLCVL